MQAVFFDPLALCGIPATGALAAQSPAQLINRNLEPIFGIFA